MFKKPIVVKHVEYLLQLSKLWGHFIGRKAKFGDIHFIGCGIYR